MKKSKLNEVVTTYNSEIEYVVKTIIGAITAQGQRKKLLQDEKVVKILEKYNITIE